jgi:serine-type D-Ala-D-Ala carboxypeptidase (penicillin-binding protein 5/6)
VQGRLRGCVVVLVVLLGVTGSASAVSERPGSSTPRRPARAARVSAASKARPAPPRIESLELPRPGQSPEVALVDPGDIHAAAAILVDARTGEALFSRNPDEPRPPASVTKILTALVILEHGRMTDTVEVSREAAQTGGHRLGLRTGQRVSLQDLLVAVLIRSANDAAVAAAEHVGGTLNRFVTLMNATAGAIGMHHSHFANPHGLDEPYHYTTARDMAALTRVALAHPTFAELVRAREVPVVVWKPARRGYLPQTLLVRSHNRLLGQLDGADGVKTGYTGGAGRCLVASASRGSQRMIAVLLNDPRRWTDAATLLEYGFGAARTAALEAPAGPGQPGGSAAWPHVAAAGMEEHP